MSLSPPRRILRWQMRRPAAFTIQVQDRPESVRGWLVLRPTEDGWSLLGPEGGLMFHSPGVRGRRRCLEYARAHGVVSVLS